MYTSSNYTTTKFHYSVDITNATILRFYSLQLTDKDIDELGSMEI